MSKLLQLTNAYGKSSKIPITKYLQLDINKGDSVFIQEYVSQIRIAVINHTQDVKIIFEDESILVLHKLAKLIKENIRSNNIDISNENSVTTLEFLTNKNNSLLVENLLNLQLIADDSYKTQYKNGFLDEDNYIEIDFSDIPKIYKR